MNMRIPTTVSLLLFLASGSSLAADPLREQAKGLFEPIPRTAPALPGNPATPETLALGKMLYFDPRLSENNDISCATCHNIGMGGVGGPASSKGHSGELAGRNVLTVLNAVFNKSQFWDGRAADLKEQVVLGVMANPAAMLKTRGGPIIGDPAASNLTKQHIVERLKSIPGYVEAFKKAFPAESDPIVYDNIGKAIAVFEATLITPDAPFDLWLTGDDNALTENQKAGLKIFIDKGCSNCHNGVNIGGGAFARFGAAQSPGSELLPSDDWGRFAVTKNVADKYAFKVASLRNLELTAPYFHTGQTMDPRKAVAIMGASQLGQKLSDGEIDKIVAFLKSLTGRQPEVVLPILPPNPPPAP
jgi:cytochrome c peroxidase